MYIEKITETIEHYKVDLNSTTDLLFSNLKSDSKLTKNDIAEILVEYLNKGMSFQKNTLNGK